MFKGLGQIASMMKQAGEIRGRMKDMQESLRRMKVEGSAGGGMVTVEMNGEQQLLACRIEKSLFDSGDREMVEDLVVAAVNQAADKMKQVAIEEMSKVTGGLDMSAVNDMISSNGREWNDGLSNRERRT